MDRRRRSRIQLEGQILRREKKEKRKYEEKRFASNLDNVPLEWNSSSFRDETYCVCVCVCVDCCSQFSNRNERNDDRNDEEDKYAVDECGRKGRT